MADNETIADIIAEMRKTKYGDAECEVKWCLTQWADRLEAALKRDTKELRVEIERLKEERNYSGVRERERLRAKGFAIVPKEQLECGDCAKLREALKRIVAASIVAKNANAPEWILQRMADVFAMATTALSVPPRNCDRFASAEEAWDAYDEWVESYRAKGKVQPFNEFGWLYAEAKEGGAK